MIIYSRLHVLEMLQPLLCTHCHSLEPLSTRMQLHFECYCSHNSEDQKSNYLLVNLPVCTGKNLSHSI